MCRVLLALLLVTLGKWNSAPVMGVEERGARGKLHVCHAHNDLHREVGFALGVVEGLGQAGDPGEAIQLAAHRERRQGRRTPGSCTSFE